jgi:hypothetical protein
VFEPSDDTPDDEQNVVMIPNIPNKLSFYISTWMEDFAASMIKKFSTLIMGMEEKKSYSSLVLSDSKTDISKTVDLGSPRKK